MWEYIKRNLGLLFTYISSLLGAIVGIFLYPAAKVFRLAVLASVITTLISILLPIIAIATGIYAHNTLGLGVVASIFTSVATAAGLTGFMIGVFPVFFAFSTLRAIITLPFEGFKNGWSDGLFSVLAKGLRLAFGREENQAPHQNHQNNQARNVLELLSLDEFDFNNMLERLANEAAIAARQPLTESEFNNLQLSLNEMMTLKNDRQAPLNEGELNKLEPSTEQKARIATIKEKKARREHLTANESNALRVVGELDSYKNLQRLKADTCSILGFRPEREDAVLLVKQYQQGEHWLPVPGAAHVFDKDSLKMWFVGSENTRGNAVHPLTRDLIKQPSAYSMGENEHHTRYVIHPFYAADDRSEEGLCQELNLLTSSLRERAERIPAPEDTSHDHDEERGFGFGMA